MFSANMISERKELGPFKQDVIVRAHKFSHSVKEIFVQLNVPWSTISDVTVKCKCHGSTEPWNQHGRPMKLIDWDQRTLKRVVNRNCQSASEITANNFCMSSGMEDSDRTICQEVNALGFRSRAAVWSQIITSANARHHLDWSKQQSLDGDQRKWDLWWWITSHDLVI